MSLNIIERKFQRLEEKEKAHRTRFSKAKASEGKAERRQTEGYQPQILRLRGYDDAGKALFHRFFAVDIDEEESVGERRRLPPRPSTAPPKMKTTSASTSTSTATSRPNSALQTHTRTRPHSALGTHTMTRQLSTSTIVSVDLSHQTLANSSMEELEWLDPIPDDDESEITETPNLFSLFEQSTEPIRKVNGFTRQMSSMIESSMSDVNQQLEQRIQGTRSNTPDVETGVGGLISEGSGSQTSNRNDHSISRSTSRMSHYTSVASLRPSSAGYTGRSGSEAWATTGTRTTRGLDSDRRESIISAASSYTSTQARTLATTSYSDDTQSVRSAISTTSSKTYSKDLPASLRRTHFLSTNFNRLDQVSQVARSSSKLSRHSAEDKHPQDSLNYSYDQAPTYQAFDLAVRVFEEELIGNIIEIHIQDKLKKKSFILSSGNVDQSNNVVFYPPQGYIIQPLRDFEWVRQKSDLTKYALYYKLYDLTFGRELLSRGKLVFSSQRSHAPKEILPGKVQIVSLMGDVSVIPQLDILAA